MVLIDRPTCCPWLMGLLYTYTAMYLEGHDYIRSTAWAAYFLAWLARMSRGRKLPRKVGDVSNGFDKATYDGHEGVNQGDTVSIPAVAHGQSIPTRVIASADPHAIRRPVVPPLAIWQTLYVNNQCLHEWNYVSCIVVPWRRRRDWLTFSIMFVTTSVIWWP